MFKHEVAGSSPVIPTYGPEWIRQQMKVTRASKDCMERHTKKLNGNNIAKTVAFGSRSYRMAA